jgi:Glycosyl transferase family 2
VPGLHAGFLVADLLATLVLLLLAAGIAGWRFRTPDLARVPARAPEGGWPPLSLVVAARDEAASLEPALRSLLAQDYPDLEVIAVDDRSSDGTGAILDRLAAEDPRLVVVHVSALPEGWLGKTHACQLGATRARGEWLLFTDADVLLAAEALRRAVACATGLGFGHLVAFPHFVRMGFLERAFVSAFGLFFQLKVRAWELPRPRTGGYVGIGAFNLVRRGDYLRAGGHRRLALEVVDDLKLGLILRRSGTVQGAVDSGGLVRLRWQAGLLASLGGLVKNAFAGVEYRWSGVLLAVVALAVLAVCPLLTLAVARDPWALGLALPPLLLGFGLHGAVARLAGRGTGLEGILFPLAGLALIGVTLWSAASASVRGAVVWRGTRYRLEDLRRACVHEADWPLDRVEGWPQAGTLALESRLEEEG